MTKYNHLNELQRETISALLAKNLNFSQIGKAIKVDRTTISKEIKRNRYIKSYHYDAFDITGINKAISDCKLLQKPPYICNNCSFNNTCHKHHLYYNSKEAQKHYEFSLKNAREGIDIKPQDLDNIEKVIVNLIKNQKQSINQVYINHSDIINISKTTFYKYVNDGILSLRNIDLPKKVKYKPRKKKRSTNQKRKLSLLKGRTYEDFLVFTSLHPKMNIIEMDTVIGKRETSKVLLTLFMRETHFMLIFLLAKKDSDNVNKQIEFLKEQLGTKLYQKVFRIFLTDNGVEFFSPLNFERDFMTGKKLSNLFYCNPYSSYQKHGVEVNHEYIRRVFPKGVSFNILNENIIKKLQDNINAIPRVSLNGNTPFNLTIKKYPELIKKLNCSYIAPDNVDLSIENIMGENNEK